MSAGGSFNPSGGPIDNQQRLQTSPNPSLPPADYSMGYARNFQPPSFFNPFSGYYGANTGMGGFQPQFGGFQQPQFGGFGGGFQQPFDGGYGGGFQQPFSGGFGGQSNRFTRRGQEYTQPQPQPQPNQPEPMPQQGMPQYSNKMAIIDDGSSTPFSTMKPQPQQITPGYGDRNRFNFDQSQFQPQPVQMSPYYGMGNFGGFNPMMGGGIGAFGGRGFMGY